MKRMLVHGIVLFALLALLAPPAAATPRSGCGTEVAPGQSTVVLTSGGLQRTFELYVPSGYDGRRPLPVVLDLHGSNSNAAEQLQRSELTRTAEANTFVVAAPQGAIPTPAGNYSWNVPVSPSGPADVAFLSDVIDWLVDNLCVDPSRVFGTGYSGGGRMISHYACTLPQRLAAIAPVAGLRAGNPRSGPAGPEPDPATCSPDRGVPVVTFHGTDDFINPFSGGGLPYWQYGVEAAAQRWAEINGCRRAPRSERVTTNVTVLAYRGCPRNAQVQLYVVEDGGHTWPGSEAFVGSPLGPVTMEISASDLMWQFFARHRQPRARRWVA